jgi:hypothetical protein
MAITSAGYTGTVDQVDFSEMFTGVADNGVVGEYNDSSLSAAKVSGQRTMLVQPGSVWAPGVLSKLTVATNATAAAALVGSSRIDLLIAKFNWSTGLTTFEMKAGTAGTGVPPAVTQTAGVVWEVPLRQGMLTTASASEYVASSVMERRYWINQGKFVLASATQLPSAKIGAVAVRPDAKQTLIYSGAGWDTYKAESDTGWGLTSIPSPGGFSGGVYGRIRNGQVELQFEWDKVGAGTGPTPVEFGIAIPAGYRPARDVDKVLIVAKTRLCRIYIQPGGAANLGPMTLNAGETLRGHIAYAA